MSTQRPSVSTPGGPSRLPRTALLVIPGGREAQGGVAATDRLACETDMLLESLEQTIARLALAHRARTPHPEEQGIDDEAFAWVQQSLEDISATLRGLSLGRAGDEHAVSGSPLRSVNGLA